MRVYREPPPAREDLVRLYHSEQLGSGDVAARLGISRSTVQYWMKRYGIAARSVAEAAKMRETKPTVVEFRRKQLAEAQRRITPEGRRRQGIAISGPRDPWSDEVHAKHSYRQSPEYRLAASKRQKGEKSHRWRGGTTDAESIRMHGWEWRLRREECYVRDNWTCQHCGCRCLSKSASKRDPGRRIQCHHIVRRRDGGTDELSNLLTVCLTCHPKIEAKGAAALFA